MKNCPNCNTVLDDRVIFCPFCGIRVGASATPAPQPETTPVAEVDPAVSAAPAQVEPVLSEAPASQPAPAPEQPTVAAPQPTVAAPQPTATQPVAPQPPAPQPPVYTAPNQMPPYQPQQPVPPTQPNANLGFSPIGPHPATSKLTVWAIVLLVGGFVGCEISVAGLVTLILAIIALVKVSKANKLFTVYERDNKIRTVKTLNIIGTAFLVVCLLTLALGVIFYIAGYGDVFEIFEIFELADELDLYEY